MKEKGKTISRGGRAEREKVGGLAVKKGERGKSCAN